MNFEASDYATLQITDLEDTVSDSTCSSLQKYLRDNCSRFQKCADSGPGFQF
jgi:hypothetical protein